MRVRHAFGIATLALLLAACSESVTGPSLQASDGAAANIGWGGGGGRSDGTSSTP
ncbi:MAG TPA: hypothetical protein VF746_18795 [Longimicrobium sp.]|jgi:Spy/CpxP family protein refolding chaperone